MLAVNYTTLRENMKDCFDRVAADRETMIVTRKGENMVIMSQSDYDSIMETLHLVKGRENYEHLMKSITQYKNKEKSIHNIIEAADE